MLKPRRPFGTALAACLLVTGSAFAADPAPPAPAPDQPPAGNDPADATPHGAQTLTEFRQELAQRRPGIMAELSSGDAEKEKQAIAEIDDWAKSAVPSRRADLLEMLVDTKHYAEAEERAVRGILRSPATNYAIEHFQKLRVRSLLKQGKPTDALSAARAYYDVSRFSETKDAIALLSACLLAAHPDDPSIAKRFKAQQVAGATATTQPSGGDLGDPVLPAIPPAPVPFPVADVLARTPTTIIGFEAKGNLLLLAGKATEAKAVFDQACAIANGSQSALAIENVARAIRAQYGFVGPANAYVTSAQQEPKK